MSVLGFNNSFDKQPSEQITVKAGFNNVGAYLAVDGYNLSSVELKLYDSTGVDCGNNMIHGNATLDSNNYAVFATFKAGNDGQDYHARYRTTWTKNSEPDQIIERDLLIQVRQKGY